MWEVVAAAVNGSADGNLDADILKKLYDNLLGREKENMALLDEVNGLLAAKHLPDHQDALLRDAQSALTQSLDGVQRSKPPFRLGSARPRPPDSRHEPGRAAARPPRFSQTPRLHSPPAPGILPPPGRAA
jgi:hypothetical protein